MGVDAGRAWFQRVRQSRARDSEVPFDYILVLDGIGLKRRPP